MYLDFILDLVNVGDKVLVSCDNENYEGVIVKINKELIAICQTNGAIILKNDKEITNIKIIKGDINDKENAIKDIIENRDNRTKLGNVISDKNQENESRRPQEKNSESTTEKMTVITKKNGELTIGKYDKKWDSIDLPQLQQLVNCIMTSLNDQEKSKKVFSNATVSKVNKHSFSVKPDKQQELNVNICTIIEKKLFNDIKSFSIGQTLRIVLFSHHSSNLDNVSLSLTPNSIGGYINLLQCSINEGHFQQAKLLCFFLFYKITKINSQNKIFELIRLLGPVNAFSIENEVSMQSPTTTSIDYKQIEKRLNDLIKEGKHKSAIEIIDKTLKHDDLDNKYRSSLLLRKAQVYSSLTDYVNAKIVYLELIHFKEETDGEPKNLSHLYTELARLQAMDKLDYKDAEKSAQKALEYNPNNKYASTILEQIKNRTLSPIQTLSGPSNIIEEEDQELILESEETKLVVSEMIEIDIREHHFTNEAILNNGGTPTSAIAKSIYEEAKATKDVDISERYPIYLEAAKAFSELPVGSYDSQDYLESVAYYAILKGNSLFIMFKKLLSEKNTGIEQLTHIKDSACSYYIESLNLLSSIESEFLLSILRNYLKMNIALVNLRNGVEPNISGQFNRVFLNCVSSNDEYLNQIAWSTIVAVGTASPKAWNKLTGLKGGTRGLYRIMKSQEKRKSIYSVLNKINVNPIDETLLPGEFLKKSFKLRTARNKKLADVMSTILKADFNIHLLNPLFSHWSLLPNYLDLLNETEAESKSAVDTILLILKPYANRNSVERTNILIQVQSKIDEQLSFINDNTTYYGRTFFFPLLRKWKRFISNILEKKIADTMPQLIVVADPPYIVSNDSTKSVNLIIKNQGESTAEGCIMIPEFVDLNSGDSIKDRYDYQNEIPAGNNLEVPMNLPSSLSSAATLKMVMSISAIYQGKEIQPQIFEFTLEKEPESSLSYEDIPWKDGPIPVEQMFKGRQSILSRLKKHYTSIERDKPYILYGLTRTGKSSILKYLGEALDNEIISINGIQYTMATFYWDLSQASNFGNAHDMWEYLLYDQFSEYLEPYIGKEGCKQLGMPDRPRAKDLNNALLFLHKKYVYPMFLVDEFSYIKVLMDNNVVNPAFLHTLRQFSLAGLASFIYAGTYDIKSLLKDPKYGITGQLVNAVEEQISKIDKQSAEELICVMEDKLKFTPDAIEHLHNLSGDVPYFVQMICKYCGLYAVEKKRSIIGYPELEYIIKILTGETNMVTDSMVKTLPENVFQNNMFSPADPIEVNVLISSIAYFNKDNKENPRGIGIVELQELWAKKNIVAFRPKLAESIELLCQKKVLIQNEDEGLPVYMLSVDLFRRWWAIHHTDIDLQLDKL